MEVILLRLASSVFAFQILFLFSNVIKRHFCSESHHLIMEGHLLGNGWKEDRTVGQFKSEFCKSLTGCVILGEPLYLSEHLFPCL